MVQWWERSPPHQCGPGLIAAGFHMWVEFVVQWFLACSEGFSPGSLVFLPPQKQTLQFTTRPGQKNHMKTSLNWCGFLSTYCHIIWFIVFSKNRKEPVSTCGTLTCCTKGISFFMALFTSGTCFILFMMSLLSGKFPPSWMYISLRVFRVACCQAG